MSSPQLELRWSMSLVVWPFVQWWKADEKNMGLQKGMSMVGGLKILTSTSFDIFQRTPKLVAAALSRGFLKNKTRALTKMHGTFRRNSQATRCLLFTASSKSCLLLIGAERVAAL